MTSAATPNTARNLTMARKPKPSAIAEASEPEIVGLYKRVIPAKAAQAAAAALTEAGFGVASAIAASVASAIAAIAGAGEPDQSPVQPPVPPADAGPAQ